MDLPKIKTLIDFVGRANITELTVTEKKVTVRIFRTAGVVASTGTSTSPASTSLADALGDAPSTQSVAITVKAPVFGVLHKASAPGQDPFVKVGDIVEEGQTLFIIEAMKVFNKIAAPCAGRIAFVSDVDGGEVETGDVLAEIV